MTAIGWIAVFIGIVNLLCGKLLPGFSFSIVGAIILLLQNYKNSIATKDKHESSITNTSSNNSSLLNMALDMKIVEKILKTNFKTWKQSDIIETVDSFKRWAINQSCNLADVKKHFIETFHDVFGADDIDDIIAHLQLKKFEEASRFKIQPRNTCTYYMVIWLNELKNIEIENHRKEELEKQTKVKVKVRNRMTASQLILKENAEIQFINNPNTNKPFFVCGSIRGYISPAVAAKMNQVTLEDLQYAECAKPGTEDWVPCLLMQGNSPLAPNSTVKRSMGNDILNINMANKPQGDELPF